MPHEKILVIEDDEDIQELMVYNLSKEGFQVTGVLSGEEGLTKARSLAPGLIVLDLMLPGIDGLEVCRTLRQDPATQHVPVMMVTAKGAEADVVAGLELGADDYLVKPFSPRVLVARVKALMRRRSRGEPDAQRVVTVGDICIHPGRHEVTVRGEPVALTAMEFRVLRFLASRPGWVYTRAQIVPAVRDDNYPATERSVDVVIVGLRKKLGSHGEWIETVRGVGYRFREE